MTVFGYPRALRRRLKLERHFERQFLLKNKMADGQGFLCSCLALIFVLYAIPNGGKTRPYDEFCSGVTAEWKAITWELHMAFLSSCLDFTTSTSWRCSRLFDAKGYFRSRASRYPNSTSTFQLIPLSVSGTSALIQEHRISNFKVIMITEKSTM